MITSSQVGSALLARPRLLTIIFALVALDALAVWWLRHYRRRRPGGFCVITEGSDRPGTPQRIQSVPR